MMTLIHVMMFGFLVGAGLCLAHFGASRWAQRHDVACPWGKFANAAGHAIRLLAVGLGGYLLVSVGWAAVPAAVGGFLVTRPAFASAKVSAS